MADEPQLRGWPKDGYPPFSFPPENMHGDPAPIVVEFTREQIAQWLTDRNARALAYFNGEHS